MHRNRSARKACQPICALNPYNNDWTIRAKVASKTPLRHFEKNGQTHSVGTLEVVDDQVSNSTYLPAGPSFQVQQLRHPEDKTNALLYTCGSTISDIMCGP